MPDQNSLVMRRVARMRVRVALSLTALFLVVSGCASTPSSRLSEPAAPVRSIWIVFYKGPFDHDASGGQEGIKARFPATFERNGTPVAGYRELPRPLVDIAALERLWDQADTPRAGTSHVLVMTAQRLKSSQGGANTLEFEAVLWDTTTRKLVWKGAPTVLVNMRLPLRRAEGLAGEVMVALKRDGLIDLPKGHPIGVDDLEISKPWALSKDR